MNLTIGRSALKSALATVATACPSSPTLPVLGTVHLTATAGKLTMRTCDLERQITTDIPATVANDGSICVPLKRLRAIVNEAPGETVDLAADCKKNTLAFLSGTYAVMLHGIAADEAPPVMATPDAEPIEISGGVLLCALRACQPAQSKDETRYILNGCMVQQLVNSVRVVATDGRRLTTVGDIDAKSTERPAVIPSDAVACLVGILTDGEPCALRISKDAFSATTPAGTLVGKLIDGAYPNWRQVIPAAGESGATVDCEALIESVHRVALVNEESCRLDIGRGGVKVSAIGADIGQAADECGGDLFGNAVYVSMRPSFVIDALKGALLYAPTASMSVKGPADPVLVTAGDYTAVIMPFRTGEEVKA